MQVRYSQPATDNSRSTPIENIRKVIMETCFVRTSRDSWTSTALSMFMLLTLALGLASLALPADAARPGPRARPHDRFDRHQVPRWRARRSSRGLDGRRTGRAARRDPDT